MTNTVSMFDTVRKEQVCFRHAVISSNEHRDINIECLDDRNTEYLECQPCKRDKERCSKWQ